MKRLITLLVFLCFAKINVAQLYQPFPTDSAVWRQLSEQHFSPVIDRWDYNYYLNGDTILSGETYHKLYRKGSYSYYQETWSFYYTLMSGPHLDDRGYVGAMREDAFKRVYFFKGPGISGVSDSVERLLYDFNLNVGDTLPTTYNTSYSVNEVASIDSVLVGSFFHKRYIIKLAGTSMLYFALIEGVGSTMGLLEELNPFFEHGDHLLCFSQSGTIEYSDLITTFGGAPAPTCNLPSLVGILEQKEETQISIFPNPTAGNINLKTPFLEKTQIEIFDVLGKRIFQSEQTAFEFTIDLSQQPKGVYFLKANSGNKISKTQKIVLQ